MKSLIKESNKVEYGRKVDEFIERFPIPILFVLSIVIAALVYWDFILGERLYVFTDIGSDTATQYWPFYHKIIEMVRSGECHLWIDNLGVGSNVFALSHYFLNPFSLVYIIGGDFPGLAVYAHLLKIFLAVFFMYEFLRSVGSGAKPAMIFSLAYSFCGFMILWGQHYHFGSWAAMFPLFLLTLEMLIARKKILWFVLVTALLAGNPYMLFPMASVSAVYAFLRLYFVFEQSLQKAALRFLQMSVFFLLGLALAGIHLLPSLYVLLESPRTAAANLPIFDMLIAPAEVYLQMLFRFFSNNITGVGNGFFSEFTGEFLNYYESPQIFGSVLALLLIPQVFLIKSDSESRFFRIFIIIVTLVLLVPFFSYLFNAFSILRFRWTFVFTAFALSCSSFALTRMINERKFSRTGLVVSAVVIFLMPIVAAIISRGNFEIGPERYIEMFEKLIVPLLFLFLFTFLLLLSTLNRFRLVAQFGLLALVVAELALESSPTVNDRVTIEPDYVKSTGYYYDQSWNAADYLRDNDKDVYRVDRDFHSVYLNDALVQDYLGLDAYVPLNNPSYLNFLMAYRGFTNDFNNPTHAGVSGVKSPTDQYLSVFLGSKYFLTKDSRRIPGDYRFEEAFGSVLLYRKIRPLPIIFAYDSLIVREQFFDSDMEIRASLLLRAFLPPDNFDGLSHFESIGDIPGQLMEYDKYEALSCLEAGGGLPDSLVILAEKGVPVIRIPFSEIVTDSLRAEIEFTLESETGGSFALYLKKGNTYMKNRGLFQYDIYPGKMRYRAEFTVLPGADAVELALFGTKGKMQFTGFGIERKPDPDKMAEQIAELNDGSLVIDSFEGSEISGRINTDRKKMVCLTVPYDDGWELEIDEADAKIHRINAGMTGFIVGPGKHSFRLAYTPPLFTAGMILSVAAVIVLIFINIRINHRDKVN